MVTPFDCIGFRIHSMDELEALLVEAATEGEPMEVPHGYYVCWRPGAGVEVWAQADNDRQLIGGHPHLSGDGRTQLMAHGLSGSPDSPLDGILRGREVSAQDGSAASLSVRIPDFDRVPGRLKFPSEIVIQMAAFARQVSCYPNPAAFYRRHSNLAHDAFIPSDQPETTGLEGPEGAAIFTGEILKEERRVNPVSGRSFHAMSIRTRHSVVDLAADPRIIAGRPLPGGIVKAACWLSARVVELGL